MSKALNWHLGTRRSLSTGGPRYDPRIVSAKAPKTAVIADARRPQEDFTPMTV
jgi:hypothetical protein